MGLVTTSGDLGDVRRWGQESIALLRRAGDHSNAANALFVMAQRYLYAGVAVEIR